MKLEMTEAEFYRVVLSAPGLLDRLCEACAKRTSIPAAADEFRSLEYRIRLREALEADIAREEGQ